MVRISDILKKLKQHQEKAEEETKAASPEKLRREGKEELKPEEAEKEEITPKDHIKFVEAMRKGKESQESHIDAHIHEIVKKAMPEKGEGQNIYNETVECCKRIAAAYKEGSQEIEKESIVNVAGRIADYIIFGGQELLNLMHEPYPDTENYRFYDLVNTGALTGHIGASLGYNKSKLIEVIIVGLFHDVGMFKDLDFVNEPRELTIDEWNELKRHPERCASFMEGLKAFSEEVIKGILYHHERMTGQGYPQGLSEEDITEYGQIVALADVYEAMIHYRPHKNKLMSPNEVIKEIITFRDALFSQRVIKALIKVIGIYPIGSWVEINTGEMCRVLSTNENLPLRPVLTVVFSKDKRRLKEVQTIDLKSNPSLYIKRPVEESELK